eukprot:366061-Chlamydomonas_euryale.AAC.11
MASTISNLARSVQARANARRSRDALRTSAPRGGAPLGYTFDRSPSVTAHSGPTRVAAVEAKPGGLRVHPLPVRALTFDTACAGLQPGVWSVSCTTADAEATRRPASSAHAHTGRASGDATRRDPTLRRRAGAVEHAPTIKQQLAGLGNPHARPRLRPCSLQCGHMQSPVRAHAVSSAGICTHEAHGKGLTESGQKAAKAPDEAATAIAAVASAAAAPASALGGHGHGACSSRLGAGAHERRPQQRRQHQRAEAQSCSRRRQELATRQSAPCWRRWRGRGHLIARPHPPEEEQQQRERQRRQRCAECEKTPRWTPLRKQERQAGVLWPWPADRHRRRPPERRGTQSGTPARPGAHVRRREDHQGTRAGMKHAGTHALLHAVYA